MLVLSRKFNEKLVLPLVQTTIQIVSVKAGVVRLGVDAPSRVKILRDEIHNLRDLALADQGAMVLSRQEKHEIYNQLNSVNLAVTMLRGFMKKQSDSRSDAANEILDRLLNASLEIQQILQSAVQSSSSEAKPAKVPTPEPISARGENVRPKKRRRALLVEDDSNERELLAGVLRMHGMDVVTVPDGEDALEFLARDEQCDVAFIDMMMPRKDGLSTIREIRKDHSHDAMKIYAMTGHDRDQFSLNPEGDGIDRWLSKPLDPQELLSDLDKSLS